MKTKDNLLKGIIIGVCVVVVPLLTIGSTLDELFEKHGLDNPLETTGQVLDEGEIGTYQISTTSQNYDVFETIINTKTGEVVKRELHVNMKKPPSGVYELIP
jgi:hypothetical protein